MFFGKDKFQDIWFIFEIFPFWFFQINEFQPLCDGSHLHYYIPTNLRPVRFIPDKDMEVLLSFQVWFCNCKQTKTRPFCDGSHREVCMKLKKASEENENT
ncbi:unnamed protein product [Onchocerca flexuosa]|uniref:ZnF_CDGSH domain-containing protein n=1 Tax=Onchocerca flexuosa TaxID=387005 RepID=A0A183HWN0_9BILA|nr:unnamed protein product [Onchocerca flexuosa]